MVDILGSIGFDSITSGLPTIKISNWTIKVKEDPEPAPQSDSAIRNAISKIKNGIKWVQESIAGFFQETQPDMIDIAEFDSFISFNGSHKSQIVKNAIENGAFRSVNKIREPNDIVIELAKGGYRAGIEEVLTNLKRYVNSTAICMVITPFGILDNLNLVGLDYSFTVNNGSNLLVAKLTFQEVIFVTEEGKEKDTAVPGAEDKKDLGRKASQLADTVKGGIGL